MNKKKIQDELIIANNDLAFQSEKSGEAVQKAYKEKNIILERIDDGFFAINENSIVTYWNNRAEILLDIKKEEVIGKNLHEVFAATASSAFYDHYERSLRENKTVHFEEFSKRTNKWFAVSAFASDNGLSVYFKDVTERKIAADKIKESELRYRSLIDQATDAICIANASLKFIDINPYACEIFGYTLEEALQLSLPDILFSEDLAGNPLRLEELKSGKTIRNERRLKTKDGTAVDMEVSTRLMEDGKLIMFGHDITERKRAEQEMSWLINNTEESFILVNRELEIISFNHQFQHLYLKYLGISVVKGDSILNYAQPERRDIVKDIYKRVLEGAEETGEINIPLKDGMVKNFAMKFKPAKDELGKIIGVFVSVIDISEKRKSEQQLIIQENRYRALVENGADAVVIISPEGKLQYASPTVEKILGYSEEEMLKLDMFSFVHPDDVQPIGKVWEQVLASPGVSVPGHTGRMLHKDGSWRWMEATVTNMLHDPAINGIVDNFRDVTEKIEAEKLREFERRDKEAMINTTEDLIWSISSDFKLIAANHAFINNIKKLVGISLKPGDELITEGKFPAEFVSQWKELYLRALKGESFIKEIYTTGWGKQAESWAETRFNPIYDGKLITGIACYSRDTTAAKIFQNKLVSINKKLETAQQIAQLGYWELDMNKDKLYWSNEVYNIWGVSPDIFEVSFKNFYNSIHPDDKEIFEQAQEKALRGKGKMNMEHRIILPGGKIKYVQEIGELIYNDKGVAIRFEGAVQDITERRKAEDEIKKSNERYHYVTKATFDAIWDWDIVTNDVFWGDAYIHLFGEFDEAGISAIEKVTKRIHPEEKDQLFASVTSALKGKDINWNYEHRYLKSDGSYAYVSNQALIVRDSDGNASRVIGAMQDISKRKQEEQRLKLLESVITNTNDSIIITEAEPLDEPGPGIVYVNDAFTKMTGYTSAEVIGKTPRILQGPKSDKYELERLSEALRKWEPCQITIINYKKNGDEYWVNLSVTPVADKKGWFTHWISVERDITEAKLIEIRLIELHKNLQKHAKELAISNAELEQFAYVASHDLQEPLRMVTGFLTQIEKKYGDLIDDKGKQYIAFAVDGAKRMRQIILDLLEFSRVGRMEDKLETVDLNEVVEEVQILFSKKIKEKLATILVDPLPVIHSYKSPMRQVFQNLISNALKYDREGIPSQIKIKVTELKTHWQFAVTDNGIGIDKEYFDKIFIIFQRLHNKDEYSGTGMGLAVTKKIIENLGGKIWVESEEGKGCTFYFTIKK